MCVMGISVLFEVIMFGDCLWIFWVGLGIVFVVGSILMFDFCDVCLVLLVFVLVFFGLVVIVGIFCWFGVLFNIMMIIVVLLIIGFGVDDGIYVVYCIWEDCCVLIDVVMVVVGCVIVMMMLMICLSFGVLFFSDYLGIESMVFVMFIGLLVCFVVLVIVLLVLV